MISLNGFDVFPLTDLLSSNGHRRLIPEFEIALAILNCSLDKYCNPDYNFSNAFLSRISNSYELNQILAPETHNFVDDCPVDCDPSSVNIKETIDVKMVITETQSHIVTTYQEDECSMVPYTFGDNENLSKRNRTEDFQRRIKKKYRASTAAENLIVGTFLQTHCKVTKSKKSRANIETIPEQCDASYEVIEASRKRSIS